MNNTKIYLRAIETDENARSFYDGVLRGDKTLPCDGLPDVIKSPCTCAWLGNGLMINTGSINAIAMPATQGAFKFTIQGCKITSTVANYTYTTQLPRNGINFYCTNYVDAGGVYHQSSVRALYDKNETASIIIQNVPGTVVLTTKKVQGARAKLTLARCTSLPFGANNVFRLKIH